LLNNLQLSETVLAALSGDVHSVTALVVQLSSIPGNHTNPAHIQPYHQLISEVSRTYGGQTAKLDDSHVLALFPAQPPSLALRAALTLRAKLDQLSQEAGSATRPGYRIGIGLHTGSAQPVSNLAAGVNEAANLSTLNQLPSRPSL
jgi:class 3 adenylate cyclase